MNVDSSPQLVVLRPVVAPTRYLSAATDKSRGLKDDFDVRCVKASSQDTQFLLYKIKENIYKISPASQPHHFLFCSNDNTRKYEDDFDVRTHAFEEDRNNWIIENIGWSAFTIRSETNPNHFLFVANDKSNHHNQDFDIRTQEKEETNNHWYIVTIPNYVHSFPQKEASIIVKLRLAHLNTHLLTLCEYHKSFNKDFVVRVGENNNDKTSFILDRIEGNAFTIRSAINPLFYLFVANEKAFNQWGDYEVRLHPFKELRNGWFIEQSGEGLCTIRSLTNQNQYLFAIQEEAQGKEFTVRVHPFVEERNKWIIDGFQG